MMHVHDLRAINVFGIGAAVVGFAGLCITTQALRETYAVPSSATRRRVLASMLFVMSVDLIITALGCLVTLLDMQIAGGARG